MRFFLPIHRLRFGLLLGITAWAASSQPVAAQKLPCPTAETLRARHKPVATAKAKADARANSRLDSELKLLDAQVGKATAVPFSWFYWASQWAPVTLVGFICLHREGLSLRSLGQAREGGG